MSISTKKTTIKDNPDQLYIRKLIASVFKPTTDVPLDEWAEANVRLPFSAIAQRFSCDPTPYLRDPIKYCSGNEVANGHRVFRVTVVGSVQSAKSTLQEVVASFAICEDPGPMMWNYQTDGDAKEAVRERIEKMFKANPLINSMLPKRYAAQHVDFPHMFVIIQGAETRDNLQSKPIRWLLNDETWLWPPGHLAEAEKRVTAFWNKMIVNTSTGGIENDDTHDAVRDGDMCTWMFTCPTCGLLQPFQIKGRGKEFAGGVTWEDNEKTRNADGTWNFAEVARHTYYECSNMDCGHRFRDSVASRRLMNSRARYVPRNNNPLPGNKSFHFNAFCVEWISWSTLAIEFLKATEAAKFGMFLPLQEFVQKRLGEFWRVQETQSEVNKVVSDYRMMDAWADEYARFMSVDVQADHFWYVVRAFAADGRSRMISCGRISGTWDDVRTMQLRVQVRDKLVLVDCSFGPGGKGPRAVYYQCCRFGWTAMMGDDAKSYSHVDKERKQVYQRPVSGKMFGDPMRGAKATDVSSYDKSKMKTRYCAMFKWSNPTIKQIVDNLWHGRGKAWDVPANTPVEWFAQIKAEIPQVVVNKTTGRGAVVYVLVDKRSGAHMRDCECMIVAAASMAGLVGDDISLPEDEGLDS